MFNESSLKIWGAPGTGKTHAIMSEVKKHIKETGTCSDITYTTFRRDTITEAREYFSAFMDGKDPEKIKNVNTIHGTCLRLLLEAQIIDRKDGIITQKDINEFSKLQGYKMEDAEETPDTIGTKESEFSRFYSWIENTGTPIDQAFLYDGYDRAGCNLKKSYFEYKKYKSEIGKIDFSDMITKCREEELYPDTKILIVDEFQDLTKQQNEVIKMWSEEAEQTIIAGDPLQAIYSFWGGSPEHFKKWDAELKTLEKSFRMPSKIWESAKRIIGVTGQEPPQIETTGTGGEITRLHIVNLEPYIKRVTGLNGGSVFHLVRANYQAKEIANMLSKNAIPYRGLWGWTDADISLLNAVFLIRQFVPLQPLIKLSPVEIGALVDTYGMKNIVYDGTQKDFKTKVTQQKVKNDTTLIKPELMTRLMNGSPEEVFKELPQARKNKAVNMLKTMRRPLKMDDFKTHIKTIHGSKGLEADTVFLHSGITAKISKSTLNRERMKEEARVWYVGVSRCKSNLVIVESKGRNFGVPGGR